MSLDDTGIARRMSAKFAGRGYPSMVGQVLPTTDVFGEWAPGVAPYELPAGVGILAKSGADLVILVRLHPSGKPEKVQLRVDLTFHNESVRSALTTVTLGRSSLYIRPGAKDVRIRDSITLPVAVRAFQILANAHFLCRSVTAAATRPDGSKVTLLRIAGWNPSWQRPYTFSSPQDLPAGTTVSAEFVYDNLNPPAKGAVFTASTSDEMALLELQTATVHPEDLGELRRVILERQKSFRSLDR